MNMKIVYTDDDKTKVAKGELLSQDEYTFTLQTDRNQITIGKRYIVSAIEVVE